MRNAGRVGGMGDGGGRVGWGAKGVGEMRSRVSMKGGGGGKIRDSEENEGCRGE
jgi:hypothetical protein